MINDRDPHWGRSFHVSSAELADLRREWAEAGREAWNAATRAGRAVKARTLAELEALGRAHLSRAELESATGRAAGRAIRGVAEATPPLKRNLDDMVDANWKGADKYFHCKGNCEAAQRGPAAASAADRLSDARETYGGLKGDPASDNHADQEANRFGRAHGAAHPGGQCSAMCARYRPQGLPSRY